MIFSKDRPGKDIFPGRSAFFALLVGSTLRALASVRRRDVAGSTVASLAAVVRALRTSNFNDSLRHIDRAWRSASDDVEVIAPIYGRLLALESRDHDAALGLFRRVAMPDADVAALTVDALLHLERYDEARRSLAAALREYCLLADGLLLQVARKVLGHPTTISPGWIGRLDTLDFVGELKSVTAVSALKIRLGGEAEFIQPIKTTHRADRVLGFQFTLAKVAGNALLDISVKDAILLGSGGRSDIDFQLDGRAWSAGHKVRGWSRLKWLSARSPKLRIQDELGRSTELTASSDLHANDRWHFGIDLRRLDIHGSHIDVSALLPTGEWAPIPGMPLLLNDAVASPGGKRPPLSRWRPLENTRRSRQLARRSGIDVVIPVYRGRRESLDCIHAALSTAGAARVVVVDDATDDVLLAAALDELEARGQILLLRNAVNRGFVGSVNRALSRSRTRDVVLLNSDAIVFGDWLERLQTAAYAAPHVGTVTPFSNSGSIASYPRTSQDSLSIEDATGLHRLAGSVNAGISLEIPVGIGFCLYIRRECLTDVGKLDEAAFGKGYGEETDFCLRARRSGWTHRLAADVFVYHAGGRSFASRRDALLNRSQRLLNLRHPGFDRFVASFIAQDPLRNSRRQIDAPRLSKFPGKFVLLVTLALTGGVARFVAERCRALRADGVFPLILRPRASGNSRQCELWTDALDVPNLVYDIPSELPLLITLLQSLSIASVEIQHFLDIDARVVDAVRQLGIPYDVMVHDYAWICPRITLIDGSGRYCHEPAVAVCEACVKRNGSNTHEKISVADLRRRSRVWLHEARHVSAPSADAANRLKRYFDVNIEVKPHSTSLRDAPRRHARVSAAASVRVALIGGIGEHKGYRVLLGCARDARKRGLPIEFVVIGYTENDLPLLKTGKVFITGRYSEGEASHLIARESPDLVLMPCIWPETWCYALDEALGAGLPVLAFDLGAVAERLRAAGVREFLPDDCTPAQINDQLLHQPLRRNTESSLSPRRDTDIMRKAEEKSLNQPAAGTSSLQEALSASVQVLPLTPGLYLFSVKSAAASSDKVTGDLQLPAMHVGLGPGVRSGQVEFIAGPTTDGAWLFAQKDCLVTKVNGDGATLVLTSVRGPGGETLAIKVERLDGRAEAAAAAVPTLVSAAAQPRQLPKPAQGELVDGSEPLPMEITAHIRTRGDMSFTDAPWAGRIAPGLWIESFALQPLEHFEAQDIEYKGLTGSGFETPWLSDAAMCGTKGMAVPLVGFAIRLKPSRDATSYDCEYSGFFKSGATVGPLRNGSPCRSTVANDPLEGIQVHLRKRPEAVVPASRAPTGVAHKAKPAATSNAGPSFGRYREANGHAVAAAGPPTKPAGKRTAMASPAKRSTVRR